MIENEAAYFKEAVRLREKYASSINIVIGFEGEWIRDSSLTLIQNSMDKFPFEFFIGSLHHVHTVPIDYDHAFYQRARDIAGGSDEKLFEDYFDSQFDMLKALKPIVVGHFDLIRLKSDEPDRKLSQWPGVWEKVLRNLDWIAGYGGILELNSAGLRKGLKEPYPGEEICKVNHSVLLFEWTCEKIKRKRKKERKKKRRFCLVHSASFLMADIRPPGIPCS